MFENLKTCQYKQIILSQMILTGLFYKSCIFVEKVVKIPFFVLKNPMLLPENSVHYMQKQ